MVMRFASTQGRLLVACCRIIIILVCMCGRQGASAAATIGERSVPTHTHSVIASARGAL